MPLRPSGNLGDTGTNTQVLARLKDGVTFGQAQAEMAAITESFRRSRPDLPRGYGGMHLIPYQDSIVGDIRVNLWLLFGATGLLLLIACSNLATLLLTRFAGRAREVSVRLAIGGSRGRLLTQSWSRICYSPDSAPLRAFLRLMRLYRGSLP